MAYALLGALARHGRLVLVAGLLAGVALPGLAVALRPWIGEMVAVLLFLAAFRVGPRQAVGAARDLGATAGFALAFQLAMPLAAIGVFALVGFTGPLALALVLMLAGSPLSGGPNLTLLVGGDPAPALRLLVVGTALLPLTVIPVFWLSPALDGAGAVLQAASRLLVIIAGATFLAFTLRAALPREPGAKAIAALDGLSALALAVVVVALMSAVGPALFGNPLALVLTLAVATAANLGLQLVAAWALRRAGREKLAAPLGIVAGNRNIALFLTALPAAQTDPLLLFIGCYQIPMFLTPLLLGRFYRPAAGPP